MQVVPDGAVLVESDASGCDVCEAGHYATDAPGDTDGVGVTVGAVACGVCPADTRAGNGSFQCASCDVGSGEGSAVGSSTCVCREGYYDGAAGGDGGAGAAPSCKSCGAIPGVRTCPMGTTVATLPLRRGYWRAEARSDAVELCGHKDDCAGGETWGNGACRHSTRGPLCLACAKNYYAGSRSMDTTAQTLGCTECNGHKLSEEHVRTLMTVAGVLAVLGLLFFLANRYRHQKVMQILALGHRVFNETKGKLDPLQVSLEGNSFNARAWNYVRPKIKSIVAFSQICSAMGLNLDAEFPRLYSSYWSFWEVVVNFNAVEFLPFNCLLSTFESKLLATTLWPIAMIGLFWASTYAKRGLSRKAAMGASLGLLYVVFPSVSVMLFWAFACDRYDYADGGHRYAHVMHADVRVPCDGDERRRIVVYAGLFCAVYPGAGNG